MRIGNARVAAGGSPPSTGGRLLIDGLLVMCRTPSLLIVPLDDLRAALRADAVVWSLRTALPLADANANERLIEVDVAIAKLSGSPCARAPADYNAKT